MGLSQDVNHSYRAGPDATLWLCHPEETHVSLSCALSRYVVRTKVTLGTVFLLFD